MRADVKYLMEQNSIMVEKMEEKSTNGIYERPAETSLSTTLGQRFLTQEMSSLRTIVHELPVKIYEMLQFGNEPRYDIGMD